RRGQYNSMIPSLTFNVALKALATVEIPFLHSPSCQRFSATRFLLLFHGEKEDKFLVKSLFILILATLIEKGRGSRPGEALATCLLTRCYILLPNEGER